MSWREHWPDVRSSVVQGDVITGCRDNDTRTYRLFVNKGCEDSGVGFHFETCQCCDLSIEDVRRLSMVLEAVIATHAPWPEAEDV